MGLGAPLKSQDIIEPDKFNNEYLCDLILKKISDYREKSGNERLTEHNTLEKAADDQARYMSIIEDMTLDNKGKEKTTADRVMQYGGTNQVEEIVGRANVTQGRDYKTYEEVAEDIASKWIQRRNNEEILNNPKYIYAGAAAFLDSEERRVYVSMVVGNHKSFNTGARYRETLKVPYTTKDYKLDLYNERVCRSCERFDNLFEWHNSLYIKGNKIYFKFDNPRLFKRLIRKPKDGLAVDIIQREQYNCSRENIVDYNQINKGYLLKPLFLKDIYKNNLDKNDRIKEIHVLLGEIPEGIDKDNIELNLLIIQDKHVCKTIPRSFVIEDAVNLDRPAQLLPDTNSIMIVQEFFPNTDTNIFNYVIYFEGNKTNCSVDDVKACLEAIDKPDLILNSLEITGSSAFKGSDYSNSNIQKKRVESVKRALIKGNKNIRVTKTTYTNSWEQFKLDVKGTEYEFLSKMSYDAAKKHINENNLWNDLDYLLENYNYAEIFIKATYDIFGPKEIPYVTKRFNSSIEEGYISDAMAVQKFIINQIFAEKYPIDMIYNLKVPESRMYSAFINNMVFLEKEGKNIELNQEHCAKLYKSYEYDERNNVIYFNKLFCDAKFKDYKTDNEIVEMQNIIDDLYETELPVNYLDELNLTFQFRIIKLMDTLDEPTQIVIDAYERIKNLVELEDNNWENAFDLAKLFIRYEDYKFSAKVMDPFIDEMDLSEEYVFTYISLCTKSPARVMTNRFATALNTAKRLNQERYCALFNDEKLSFQVFDNPFVKETYCKTCVGE